MTRELLIDLAIRYGFQVLGALVILGVGAILGRWLGGMIDQRLRARAMEPPMRLLIVRVLRIVVMLFAVVVALDKFGFQIAPLVAGIGVAGLGIGIALQGVLSNVVAGLSIIFTKPFRVGEYIALLGVQGEVSLIELFSTTLVHPDRSRVVIPNRKIVGEILHNYGAVRQLALSVQVGYGSDRRGQREVEERNVARPRGRVRPWLDFVLQPLFDRQRVDLRFMSLGANQLTERARVVADGVAGVSRLQPLVDDHAGLRPDAVMGPVADWPRSATVPASSGENGSARNAAGRVC